MKRKMFSLFTTIVLLICFFVTSSIKTSYAEEVKLNLEGLYNCAGNEWAYQCTSSKILSKCLKTGKKRIGPGETNLDWQDTYGFVDVFNCEGGCIVPPGGYPDKPKCLDKNGQEYKLDEIAAKIEKELSTKQQQTDTGNFVITGDIVNNTYVDEEYFDNYSSEEYTKFSYCDISGDKGISTALGCIPFEAKAFSAWLIGILFGISGGIALLLMVYGFILVATSSGDEKKLQGAKETITSAITGLLVSIFALLIFRLIAVNILHIPGF